MYRAFHPPLRRPLKPKQDLRAAVPGILCRQSSLQGSVCSDEAWHGSEKLEACEGRHMF
jgi:hypothetical protein